MDIGPKAYKIYRDGSRKVIRFSVGLMPFCSRKKTKFWYVMDMDTGTVAAKTSKTGYTDKGEAMAVARKYRDTYGAYVRADF